MRLATVAWYASATGAVLAFLWLVGLPIQLATEAVAGRRERAMATPLFGLFVVTVSSWYLLDNGHTVSRLPIVLLVVAAATSAIIIAARPRRRRAAVRRAERMDALTNLSTVVTVFALDIIVSLFMLGSAYSTGHETVLSLFNADPASYGLHAQFMLDVGFRHAGPIAGYNLGTSSKLLGYGADALIASAAAMLRTDVLHVLELAILVANFLGVYGLVRLLNGRLGVSRGIAILASQAAYGVFFVNYLQGNFFLSQLLAMALLPAFLTLLIDVAASESFREWLGTVLAMGALAAAGIAIYPQMALLSAAVFVPAATFGGHLGGVIRRTVRSGTALLGGIGLGAGITPGLTRIGWHLASTLSSTKAGWPISGLLVTDMLGFQTSIPPQHPIPHHSRLAWVVSGVVLLGVIGSMLWSWRRRAFRPLTSFAAVALTVILVSYGLVFLYEGVSYQQWKWITYFIPLFVALVVSQVLSTLSLLRNEVFKGMSLPYAVGGAYLLAITALATSAGFPAVASPGSHYAVTADTAAVARSPQVQALPSVNIKAGTKWDTMWLAYFLRNKRVYLLSPSYFPIQKPGADWTIESTDIPPPSGPVIQLNPTYRLVHLEPATH